MRTLLPQSALHTIATVLMIGPAALAFECVYAFLELELYMHMWTFSTVSLELHHKLAPGCSAIAMYIHGVMSDLGVFFFGRTCSTATYVNVAGCKAYMHVKVMTR